MEVQLGELPTLGYAQS